MLSIFGRAFDDPLRYVSKPDGRPVEQHTRVLTNGLKEVVNSPCNATYAASDQTHGLGSDPAGYGKNLVL